MKTQLKKILLTGLTLFILAVACTEKNTTRNEHEQLPADIIFEWNGIAYNAFGGTTYQHSLMASRINAMVHIAMHDAINAVHPVFETYAFKGKQKNADVFAAAVSAAHTVLVHEISAKKNFLDSALAYSLAKIKDGESKTKGFEIGKQAAEVIIDMRKNDGSAENPMGQIQYSATAGIYQAVPPFNIVFAPSWVNMKPFGLQHPAQFRSAPHPALNSEAYIKDYNEVKEIGKLNSGIRKQDQTSCAKFWYEFSEAGWNRVARIVANNKKLNLHEAARLFAMTDMALADSYIAGWDSKFHYNFWRPYTAIRRAASDGNDATEPDTSWLPSEPTPPVHDYPSTHSALGNAAATVLAKLLGDATSFTMESPTALPANSTRSFTSFSQAADENADSRVMAGIHFRFSCTAGQQMGDKIGSWIADNFFKPVNQKQ